MHCETFWMPRYCHKLPVIFRICSYSKSVIFLRKINLTLAKVKQPCFFGALTTMGLTTVTRVYWSLWQPWFYQCRPTVQCFFSFCFFNRSKTIYFRNGLHHIGLFLNQPSFLKHQNEIIETIIETLRPFTENNSSAIEGLLNYVVTLR